MSYIFIEVRWGFGQPETERSLVCEIFDLISIYAGCFHYVWPTHDCNPEFRIITQSTSTFIFNGGIKLTSEISLQSTVYES